MVDPRLPVTGLSGLLEVGKTALVNRFAGQSRGDRRQEIVFIGIDAMNEGDCKRLNTCPVGTPEHFTPEAWLRLSDPFPAWQAGAA